MYPKTNEVSKSGPVVVFSSSCLGSSLLYARVYRPYSTVILSRALALAQGTAASPSSGRWWSMGKARDKAGKRGAAGQQADKAKERSERARLRKDRQRNSIYSSSADDREFEAQVRERVMRYRHTGSVALRLRAY